jgi:hypothetical protein
MFPEVNTLPRAQRETSGLQRNAEVHRRQRCADVRGHIVITFRSVNEKRVAITDEPREKTLEVAPHIRIGIFLDQQRSGRVPQMQRDKAVFEMVLEHPIGNRIREFVQSPPVSGDGDFVKRLPKHGSTRLYSAGFFASSAFSKSGLRGNPAAIALS